jgi:hypothetical protein
LFSFTVSILDPLLRSTFVFLCNKPLKLVRLGSSKLSIIFSTWFTISKACCFLDDDIDVDCWEVVDNGRSISDSCEVVDVDLNGSRVSDGVTIIEGDVDLIKLEPESNVSSMCLLFFILNPHSVL